MFLPTSVFRFSYFLACTVMLLPQPGLAADATNGSRLAQRWCEACHAQSRSSSAAFFE
jgi:cytochrome c2